MNKNKSFYSFLLIILLLLSGCNNINDKSTEISTIYIVTTVISLIVFLIYCLLQKRKNVWYMLMLFSIVLVNFGYLKISISTKLEEALMANRIAYFGSALLPATMLMILFNDLKIKYHKYLPYIFFSVSFIVFVIAASQGYSTIYYEEVSLEIINGTAILNKVYGQWHSLYFIYLVLYYLIMMITISNSFIKKHIDTISHAIMLLFAYFSNFGIWLIEQYIKVDFEILSVSYLITEFFLLVLSFNNSLTKQNHNKLYNSQVQKETIDFNDISQENINNYIHGLSTLTPTEKLVLDYYIEGKSTKEIMGIMNIKENTIKYHNKNIYSKLCISSRKQMKEIYSYVVNNNLK